MRTKYTVLLPMLPESAEGTQRLPPPAKESPPQASAVNDVAPM